MEVDIEDMQKQRFKLLQDRQRQLLAQLDDLKHASILELATELVIHKLEQEYNQVADGKEGLLPQKGSDPLDVLPIELVTEIFEVVASEDIPLDFIAPLMLVSRQWMHAVCSIPSLWTYVAFAKSDALATGITSLELSDPLHITVHVELPYEDWLHVADQVVAQAHRIKELTVVTHTEEEGKKFLADFPRLPILHTLQFLTEYPSLVTLSLGELATMPSLVRASGIAIQNDIDAKHKWEKRDSISTDQITDAVIDRWVVSTGLSYLDIHECPVELVSFSKLLQTSRSIQSVTHLYYFLDSLSPEETLLPLILPLLPNLRNVVFSSPATELLDVLCTLNNLMNLQALSAYIDTEPRFSLSTAKMESLLQKPTIHRLSDLGIYCSGYPVNLEKDGASVADHCFYRCLRHFLPSIGRLDLSNMSITEEACHFIQGISDLSSLYINGCNLESHLVITSKYFGIFQWDHPVPYLGAPITFATPPRRLALAENSSNATLGMSVSNPTSVLQPLRSLSGPGLYEMIHHLTIGGYVSSVALLGPLPTLHILEFHTNFLTKAQGRHPLYIGDLLVPIALRPLDYPRLVELRLMSNLVEWDLLLILLERRNITVQPEATPIKVVCTQSVLPYVILSPLTSLLSGHFPVRDRLTQYSMEQVGVGLSNPSLGCLLCRSCFRSCDWRTNRVRGFMLPDEEVEELSHLLPPPPPEVIAAEPPLSSEHQEWLSRRQERLKIFQQQYIMFWRQFDDSSASCGAYSDYRFPHRITRYTLNELSFDLDGETST